MRPSLYHSLIMFIVCFGALSAFAFSHNLHSQRDTDAYMMFQCIISTFHLNALCVVSHSSYTKVQRFSAHDPEQTNYSNTFTITKFSAHDPEPPSTTIHTSHSDQIQTQMFFCAVSQNI
eukprot:24274_1